METKVLAVRWWPNSQGILNSSDNWQKDYAGETMEKKKEVMWFDVGSTLNFNPHMNAWSHREVAQLFDAYHAQKVELKEAKESWDKYYKLCVKVSKEAVEAKQPAEPDEGWRESINFPLDKDFFEFGTEYRVQQRRTKKPVEPVPTNEDLAVGFINDSELSIDDIRELLDIVDQKIAASKGEGC